MPPIRIRTRIRKSGFTLVEVMLVTVLLTIGVVSLLQATSAVMTGETDIENIDVATVLARDLMDEILSKGFDDPDGGAFGTEEAEPRSNFDDVDDYDGWSKSPPQSVSGTSYDGTGGTPNYTNFTRAVTVENVPVNDFNAATPSPDGTTGAKRIVVTVSWKVPGGTPQAQLKAVVSEYHQDLR